MLSPTPAAPDLSPAPPDRPDGPLLCSLHPEAGEFSIGIEFLPGRTLLWAAGELDLLTAGPLASEIDAHLLDPRVPCAVLDLRDITFIDCQAAGMLVEKTARARALGVTLRVVPGRAVMRLNQRLGPNAFLELLDAPPEDCPPHPEPE